MRRWLSAAPLALAVAALAAPAQEPEGIKARLAQIKKVGREGAGNAEAARAWKALVAEGTPALLPILDAIEDDSRLASNWLRPAFEAIAESAQKDGKALPRDALEKFIRDTKKAGTARRIAYEWLVKADGTAPERLLPGMLLDPSPELRRDAIDRALKEAEKLDPKSAEAKAAYLNVLKGATDEDQVETIAKALEKTGEKVDLTRHYGFVTTWHLVAPFDHHKGVGWDKEYPPEKGVDLTASYDGKGGEKVSWKEHTTKLPKGMVDLNKALGATKGAVAYAHATVESEAERPVELRIGCINGLKVFLNGKRLFALEEYHHGMRMDQYHVRGTLKKGKNEVLLKVCQNEQKEPWAQSWQFQLRLCDYAGSAVPFTQKAAKKEEK